MRGPALAGSAAAVVVLLTAIPGTSQVPVEKNDRPVLVGKPYLSPVWKATAIGLSRAEDVDADSHQQAQSWVAERYAEVIKDRRTAGKPLIPPAVPAGVGDFVVYVTDRAVAIRAVRRKKYNDEDLKPGELAWAGFGYGGLVQMSRDLGPRWMAGLWAEKHRRDRAGEIWFHRTLCRSFVVNGGYVHWVDELGIVPPEKAVKGMGFGVFTGEVKSNDLTVWDIETGKLVTRFPTVRGVPWEINPAAPDRHVLGPPVVAGNLWYLMEDRAGKIFAQCRDWQEHAKHVHASAEERDKASRIWEKELFQAPTSVTQDPQRRINAIHAVKSGDLVVYPTHLGYVVAVDAKTGNTRWFFEYTPISATRFETFAPEWVVVPPVVVGDKYIYAPADFPELLCLNVADGKKVWSVKKGDGLHPAVVGEQVLVIGEKTIRGLNLKDGSEKWKADLPGLPCGRGAVLGDNYLVPVSEPKTWRGMIAVVDLKAGKIAEVLKPDRDEPIGNLVVHEDVLISQTLTEIAVFPIKKAE